MFCVIYLSDTFEASLSSHRDRELFKCRIEIETLFLVESASAKSFMVSLVGLRELSKGESSEMPADILMHTAVTPLASYSEPEVVDEFDTPQEESYEMPLEVEFDNKDSSLDVVDTVEIDNKPEETYLQEEPLVAERNDEMIDLGDLSIDVDESEEPQTQSEDDKYHYDPHVASEELGLPLDLIEEFIGDFIIQAKEFKEDIYSSLNSGEFDRVKILSHKLKGVAANLRVEDALEALTIVNSSKDKETIQKHLNSFYRSMSKLEDDRRDSKMSPPPVAKEAVAEPESQSDELYSDLLIVNDIDDVDVPQKIEMPELADDEFVSDEEFENDLYSPEILLDEEMPVQKAEEMSLTQKYSKESAAREIGLDVESYSELLKEFLKESRLIVEQIRERLQERNLDGTKHEAEKLQSMCEGMRIEFLNEELKLIIDSRDLEQKDRLLEAAQQIDNALLKVSKEEE